MNLWAVELIKHKEITAKSIHCNNKRTHYLKLLNMADLHNVLLELSLVKLTHAVIYKVYFSKFEVVISFFDFPNFNLKL